MRSIPLSADAFKGKSCHLAANRVCQVFRMSLAFFARPVADQPQITGQHQVLAKQIVFSTSALWSFMLRCGDRGPWQTVQGLQLRYDIPLTPCGKIWKTYMRINTVSFVALFFATTVLTSAYAVTSAHAKTEIINRSDVTFIPLNPLRGDKGPQSGKLWGDIRKDVPSGSLVVFQDGFQSPPHIHNITYRAVVISGAVHNDDPDAAKMWMGPGSYWTQPLGESHITAAKGKSTTIFLEILSGPYLVKPAKEAFDAGERPINIDARNVVWLHAEDTTWITGEGPKLAYLWGTTTGNGKNGTYLKLPSGYNGVLSTDAANMRVVTIEGGIDVKVSENTEKQSLAPGSYIGSTGTASHQITCTAKGACLLYLHTDGKFQLSPFEQ